MLKRKIIALSTIILIVVILSGAYIYQYSPYLQDLRRQEAINTESTPSYTTITYHEVNRTVVSNAYTILVLELTFSNASKSTIFLVTQFGLSDNNNNNMPIYMRFPLYFTPIDGIAMDDYPNGFKQFPMMGGKNGVEHLPQVSNFILAPNTVLPVYLFLDLDTVSLTNNYTLKISGESNEFQSIINLVKG